MRAQQQQCDEQQLHSELNDAARAEVEATAAGSGARGSNSQTVERLGRRASCEPSEHDDVAAHELHAKGPMEGTIDAFWHSVWEYETNLGNYYFLNYFGNYLNDYFSWKNKETKSQYIFCLV